MHIGKTNHGTPHPQRNSVDQKKRAGPANTMNVVHLQAMAKGFRGGAQNFADDRFVNALLESQATSTRKKGKLSKPNKDHGESFLASNYTSIAMNMTDKHKHTHGAPSLKNTPTGTLHHGGGNTTPAHLESREQAVPTAEKLTTTKVVEALLSRYPNLRRDMLADEAEDTGSDSSIGAVAPSIVYSSRNLHLD